MEYLTQKYTKYFYIALLCGIIWQLLEVIIKGISCNTTYATMILLVLSIINIVILGSSIKHNIKQQFTECKATTKIARFTVALLVIFQALLCFLNNPSWIALGNHTMTIIIIEIGLTYRIKSIEHLEKLAKRFSTDREHIILK